MKTVKTPARPSTLDENVAIFISRDAKNKLKLCAILKSETMKDYLEDTIEALHKTARQHNV